MCEITIDCIYIVYGFIFLCFYWFIDGYIKGIKKYMKESRDTIKIWMIKLEDIPPEENTKTKRNKS